MKTEHAEKCPIWGTPASSWLSGDNKMILVDSPRAGGKYGVTRINRLESEYKDVRMKARLTSWLVEQRLLGTARPKITHVETEDALKRQPLSALERADRLLKYFEKETRYPGKSFGYDKYMDQASDHFLQIMAWSESVEKDETDFFVDYLIDQGWIEETRLGSDKTFCLTVEGYVHLAELEKKTVDSSQAFVAMWFDPSMYSVWQDGISPAIGNTGYTPKRIDKEEHVDKIDDRIIAEIRRSRFIVADFTHGGKGIRGGVYYEAGFAHGLDIPVIFTCRKDLQEEIHFDTRQYNHIFWETPEELREKLEERIGAVIGQGPVRHEEAAEDIAKTEELKGTEKP